MLACACGECVSHLSSVVLLSLPAGFLRSVQSGAKEARGGVVYVLTVCVCVYLLVLPALDCEGCVCAWMCVCFKCAYMYIFEFLHTCIKWRKPYQKPQFPI